ncbi:MAG: Uma2 family endonuclease [Bacteroidota bacterium]
MALSTKILPNYTFADYLQWEGEWELIEGIPYAMSPMPSPRHQSIAGKVHSEFLIEIRKKGCRCEVYQPIDLKVDENTVVHPDLLVVCPPIEKQFLDFAPELVVEILSPSTREKDKITKLELYQNFRIKYYLIIDPENNSIAYYRLDAEGKYEALSSIETFDLKDNCTISPDLSSIWS